MYPFDGQRPDPTWTDDQPPHNSSLTFIAIIAVVVIISGILIGAFR